MSGWAGVVVCAKVRGTKNSDFNHMVCPLEGAGLHDLNALFLIRPRTHTHIHTHTYCCADVSKKFFKKMSDDANRRLQKALELDDTVATQRVNLARAVNNDVFTRVR